MDSRNCQNCIYLHGPTSTCRANPPTIIQHALHAPPHAATSAFPVVEPDWGCGRWRSTVAAKGTQPKLSDEEIRSILAKLSEPAPNTPPMALKRSEMIRELIDRGMTYTPAVKRLGTLVKRGVIQMGPNPWPRAYPTPGVYYWVPPEEAGIGVLEALRRETELGNDIGVRELHRRHGDALAVSLATLQRRLEELLAEGKAFRNKDGQWSVVKPQADVAANGDTIEVD